MAASAAQLPTDSGVPEGVEECVVKSDDEDIRESIDNCSKSLIGKLPLDRSFSVGTLETALHVICRQPDGFQKIQWLVSLLWRIGEYGYARNNQGDE
ncbi:hypothetical protein PIB30_069845 [Stylosanthes scabra]|uniref:Uncharacterized protein n=1 Tax=Stylosanthes scabra TaxID=79078 RepID=A0ABU6QPC6_9FABA|nr:hypothetical protein [Stylosanthes scabra]